ncbi:hypothetical protein V6N11_072084 [Hibiscus sabdariffa]|uniref:Uncharacterized protein n=1 Tax=Hibiscus sabdariffa TaxID=183260 RepID=A0ABR2U204_9ROSI
MRGQRLITECEAAFAQSQLLPNPVAHGDAYWDGSEQEEEVTEVRTETGDATEEATIDVPGGTTGNVTKEATVDVPGDATEEACGDATSDLHEEATADVTGDAIEEALEMIFTKKLGANIPVNAPKRKENQQSDTSVRLPKLQVKRPTSSPSETSPFVFIPTPGLASHPTTQQSCLTQQPGSVMTVRLMPTSQEHCSVDQSLSQSSTLAQNVQENNNNEGLRKKAMDGVEENFRKYFDSDNSPNRLRRFKEPLC